MGYWNAMPRPGSWKGFEQFGRFEASETLDDVLELPEGEVLISSVGLSAPDRVAVELVGPDGTVALRRERSNLSPDHESLMRIVSGMVATPGLHRLRVRGLTERVRHRGWPVGPGAPEPWLILVGRAVTASEMVSRSIPGLGLLRRRARGD